MSWHLGPFNCVMQSIYHPQVLAGRGCECIVVVDLGPLPWGVALSGPRKSWRFLLRRFCWKWLVTGLLIGLSIRLWYKVELFERTLNELNLNTTVANSSSSWIIYEYFEECLKGVRLSPGGLIEQFPRFFSLFWPNSAIFVQFVQFNQSFCWFMDLFSRFKFNSFNLS